MKNLSKFTILMTLVILFTIPLMAASAFTVNATRTTVGNDVVLTFTGTIDSVDTLTSTIWSPSNFDNSGFSSYPVAYGRILASTAGLPRVLTVVQGSYDKTNWFVVDTVGTAAYDSLETYANSTMNMNGLYVPWQRLVIYGLATNRSDTAFRYGFYFYRRD